jgi:hypothetical protein
VLGNRLAWGKDDRDRKINFVSRMCELKSLADKIEDREFPGWFAKAQVEIEKHCALVESAVRWRRRERFVSTRKKCAELQNIGELRRLPADPPDGWFPMNYQSGREHIKEIIDDLIATAK